MSDKKTENFWENEEFRKIFDETTLLQLGIYFFFGKDNIEEDIDKAETIFQICFRMYDSGTACFLLGKLYSRDDESKYYETAAKYYQMALDRDVGDAYFPLGYMYFNGYGVKRDRKKALELLESSIEFGDAEGMYFTSILYSSGIGVKKDEKRALELLKKASELGHEQATQMLKNE